MKAHLILSHVCSKEITKEHTFEITEAYWNVMRITMLFMTILMYVTSFSAFAQEGAQNSPFKPLIEQFSAEQKTLSADEKSKSLWRDIVLLEDSFQKNTVTVNDLNTWQSTIAPIIKDGISKEEETSLQQALFTQVKQVKSKKKNEKSLLEKFGPIIILLVVVSIVLARLPKVEGVDHSAEYRKRRVFNWLPLGLTYAFLYMGRYNIKVSQHAFGDLNLTGKSAPDICSVKGIGYLNDTDQLSECIRMMTNQGFADIFFWGTLTYGCSFIINGPLTDRIGGKLAILIGAGGSAVANILMGLVTWSVISDGPMSESMAPNLTIIFSALYAVNMYFQSFGAVSIVKVNAPWFHVRERGVFGAIFGILISLGIYLAFDVGYMIIESFTLEKLFLIPSVILVIMWVIVSFSVKNTPGESGFEDFDTGDASSGDDGPRLPVTQVFKMMLTNPVIVTIALIEFCSGFLRQAIMQWFRTFAKQTDDVLHLKGSFVYDNWGMLLCCAGIMGGMFAGIISDRVFNSRRGPVAAILYGLMLLGAIVLTFTYTSSFVGWLAVFMSLCIIGVHGMLSGTASMDFGGKKNVGTAVGIIDGFVYAGTAVMAITYKNILPSDNDAVAAGDPQNWIWWPIAMIPVALIGLVLSTRVWNAKPKGKKSEPAPASDKEQQG